MAKLIHRGALIDGNGNVSALCFQRPRKIDLARASWTNRDYAVTCKKCIQAMKSRNARPIPTADGAK